MHFFGPKSIFLPKASKFFVTHMTRQQKDNIFVFTPLHGGPRGSRRGPFLARKSAFFYATPMKPPFFRLRRPGPAPLSLWVIFLVARMVPTSFVKIGPKLGVFAMNTRPLPKRVTLGNRGRKTARRAAKRPPTGKPKLSRVTSGYGGLMIGPVRSV